MQHLYSLLYFAWCFFLSPPFIVFDVVVVVVDIDVIYFCCVFLFLFICWSFYQQILVGGSISVSSFLNETDSKRTDIMIYWQQPISECSYILLSISQTDRWIDRQTDRQNMPMSRMSMRWLWWFNNSTLLGNNNNKTTNNKIIHWK